MPIHRLLSSSKLKINKEGKIVHAEPLLMDLEVWFHQWATLILKVVDPVHQSSGDSWTEFWVQRRARTAALTHSFKEIPARVPLWSATGFIIVFMNDIHIYLTMFHQNFFSYCIIHAQTSDRFVSFLENLSNFSLCLSASTLLSLRGTCLSHLLLKQSRTYGLSHPHPHPQCPQPDFCL